MPEWLSWSLAQITVFPPLRIVFLIIVAFVIRYVAHRLINRSVRRAISQPPKQRSRAVEALTLATRLPAERRAQRIQALGSLAKSVITVVILVITVIMILSELGFNVTTIIAGTSLIGVTLAFGLQNIVKDFLAGVFMLIEDQLGVGDYVDMEKASGTVEEIGLRVTQLRDDNGTVWYVRNGEVLRVGNFSQGGPGRPPEPEPEPEPDPDQVDSGK
ncbi:mechanosensitive ion channel family protein [Microlunatus speluncae]|uniref:mechanosensitive ion channel family protein n=1 Tax=Microlunatus speluncae TaxID=2594267 RepID=UPI0012660BC6|nr:mechanosensitive ion channel domain-containing protein [Microlunatus speluncae]